jgi:hypothetical protein
MTDKKTLPRREFFKKGGAALGVAGAAIACVGTAEAAVLDAGDASSGDYQVTEHVKTYYELAKF